MRDQSLLAVFIPVTNLNVYYLKQGIISPAKGPLVNPTTGSQEYTGSLFYCPLGSKTLKRK